MLRLFKDILLLSITRVNPADITAVADFIQTEVTDPTQQKNIQAALSANPKLKKWHDVLKDFLNFIDELSKAYGEVFHAKVMSCDEFLPSMIAVLPNDKNALEAISIQLDLIKNFNLCGAKLNYYLTVLFSAVTYKIELVKKGECDGESEKYEVLSKYIAKQEQEKEIATCKQRLAPISNAGMQYKNELLKTFELKLCELYPSLHKKYFCSQQQDEIILKIHSDATNNTQLIGDTNLKRQLEKCVAMYLLSHQFNNEKPTEVTLATFAELVKNNEAILSTKIAWTNTPLNTTISNMVDSSIFKFFLPLANEEVFLKLAVELATQIHAENEAYSHIRALHAKTASQISLATPQPW